MLEAEWFPSKTEYDPKITKEKWIDILSDKDITQDNCLHILACFYESGYKGTCTQLEKKYNDKEESYNRLRTAINCRWISILCIRKH